MSDKDDSIADVIVDAFDTSVRASVEMIKLPVQLYAEMVQRCAKAIEAAIKEYEK